MYNIHHHLSPDLCGNHTSNLYICFEGYKVYREAHDILWLIMKRFPYLSFGYTSVFILITAFMAFTIIM